MVGGLLILLSGCATAPSSIPIAVIKPENIPGTFHRVEKGQTLWKISKIYNIDIEDLAQVNHISDSSKIETGQKILIPKYLKKQEIVKTGPSVNNDDFDWPLRGKIIAYFGQTSNSMINKGINIAPISNYNITASRSGSIVFCNPNFPGFGKTIIIDHGDGLSTVYARNAEVFVKTGDIVSKGTIIAKAGQTGRDKNTYLHFEIRKGSLAQNPYFYLPD